MIVQTKIWDALTPLLRARFARKVDQRHPEECWPWTGAKRHYRAGHGGSPTPYGTVKWSGVFRLAHRVAYVIAAGADIPEGLVVDHKCMNKLCCNPGHLEAITQGENVNRYFDQANPKGLCKYGHPRERGKYCRACNRDQVKRWMDANPEKRLAIQRRYDSKRRQKTLAA